MKLIVASNNKDKIAEIKAILSEMGFEVISQSEAGCNFEVDETGTTFAENAYLKAAAVVNATGEAAIADDSGLMVDALNGAPGVNTARYTPAGHEATYKENYEYLLHNMEQFDDRKARFVTDICCLFPNGDMVCSEGECRGQITRAPVGDGGFGYDPVFMPDGYEQTMAQLGTEVKNRISHRANALKEFRKKLREYNGTDK